MVFIMAAAVLAGSPVTFPMESTGLLEAYSFFTQTTEHFVYGRIGTEINVMKAWDFSLSIGLSMETYMGESWNSPEMKFNIFEGHWNIRAQIGYSLDPLLLRMYTDHECFHNIDMPDDTSQYMNNIKLGVVLDSPPPEYGERVSFLPAGLPDGWFSVGVYTPRNETFQKGHDFRWSMHGFTDLETAAWRNWHSGLRYRADLYFHDDGSGSSRHRGELYAAYQASAGTFETHLTWVMRDTQPFRPLDGKTFWGIRFLW